jgi:hypothetical protein
MSPNLCELYFARNASGALGGHRLYRARRH